MRDGQENSVRTVRAAAVLRLRATGVDAPDLDARLLLGAATGLDASALAADPGRLLQPNEGARFEALLVRRLAREPMSQILGCAGFWTLDLKVSRDVLSPRPETETVLEAALAATDARASGRVLDLGVGPGTLLFAFLAERPAWSGVGVDASQAALDLAAVNARALGLQARAGLARGDWDAALAEGGFDLVLSNPPYIPSGEIAGLEPEVRDHEPRLALDGGADGLDAYRRIAAALPRLLAPDGVAVLEVGAGQAPAVTDLLTAALPQGVVSSTQDLAGRDRALTVRKGPRG